MRTTRTEIADELADVLIQALNFANAVGLDATTAIQAKLEKNAARYPTERARGTAKKYTELWPS